MLSPRRTLAIARKEFLHVGRDPWSLGMAIAIPMLMLLLFGYALTLDVDRVPLVIYDQSKTPVSRELISRFTGSRYFTARASVDQYKDVERLIDKGDALVALVIPRDFSQMVSSGRRVSVQLLVDASDANTGQIALGYAQAVAQDYNQDLQIQALARQGQPPIVPAVDLRPRVWYNTDLESKNFIVPGLIAVIMMVIAALLTSLTVAREWERGTMEQLISTPVKGPELVVGKLLPYWTIGMLDVVLAFLVGRYLYSVPMRGSEGLLFGLAAIFLVGAMAMGILISIMARNQLVASQLAILTTFVPSYLLSGFLFAVSNMPHAIQVLTYLIPATYFIRILRGIYLKGVGLEILAAPAALMLAFSVTMTTLAIIKFKKRL